MIITINNNNIVGNLKDLVIYNSVVIYKTVVQLIFAANTPNII